MTTEPGRTTDPKADPESGPTNTHLDPAPPKGEDPEVEAVEEVVEEEVEAEAEAEEPQEDNGIEALLRDPEDNIDDIGEDDALFGDWTEEEDEEVEAETEAEAEEVAQAEAPAEAPVEEPEPEPAPAKRTLEDFKKFHQSAIDTFKKEFGADFDEFDQVHVDALSEIKSYMKQEQKWKQSYANKFNAAQAEFKRIAESAGGEAFVKAFTDQLDDLTVREKRQLDQAEAQGDFSKTLELARKFAVSKQVDKKLQQVNSGSSATQPAKKGIPPKTISSGTGSTQTRRAPKETFGLSDLGLEE